MAKPVCLDNYFFKLWYLLLTQYVPCKNVVKVTKSVLLLVARLETNPDLSQRGKLNLFPILSSDPDEPTSGPVDNTVLK